MGSSRTDRLPDDILLDTAVLTVKRSPDGVDPAVTTPIGASRGGLEFDPGREMRTLEYDGRRHKKVGYDRTVGWDAKITGTMLELSAGNLEMLEPGAVKTFAAAVVGPPAVPAKRTITPKVANALLAEADYVEEPRLTYARGNGGTASVVFPFGLVATYKIQGQDKNEGEFPVTIEARAEADADDDVAPFWFEITGPDITA